MVSEVLWKMPEQFVDQLDKLLVKSVYFCQFLETFAQDLKIEKIQKETKVVKNIMFQGFVCYEPVKIAGLPRLRRKYSKW